MDGDAHHAATNVAQASCEVQMGVGKPRRLPPPKHIHENRHRKVAE